MSRFVEPVLDHSVYDSGHVTEWSKSGSINLLLCEVSDVLSNRPEPRSLNGPQTNHLATGSQHNAKYFAR